MPGGNDIYDPAGGSVAFQEHFVTVKKRTAEQSPFKSMLSR
jgi:hypothetical protein